jgi:hypothetical protein
VSHHGRWCETDQLRLARDPRGPDDDRSTLQAAAECRQVRRRREPNSEIVSRPSSGACLHPSLSTYTSMINPYRLPLNAQQSRVPAAKRAQSTAPTPQQQQRPISSLAYAYGSMVIYILFGDTLPAMPRFARFCHKVLATSALDDSGSFC